MAATRSDVVNLAVSQGIAQVNWKQNEAQILEYFTMSTGHGWTKAEALSVSWCTYFVHWVLIKAEVTPLPRVGDANHLGTLNSCSRFMKSFGGCYDSIALEKGTPEPGDMYYKHVPNDHIGFIVKVEPSGAIWTIDGNSGPDSGRGFFDISKAWTDRQGKTHNAIGAGYVYPSQSAKSYHPGQIILIKLPDNA